MLRVLIVTKIFPNAREPAFAPYNLEQFRRLREHCEVTLWAPVPWLPGAQWLGGRSRAGVLSDLPERETVEDFEVLHPRILHAPGLRGLIGPLYAASLAPRLFRLRGDFDVVMGAFAYPDGYAAIRLAALLGVPSVVKLHGGDINMVAKLPGPAFHLRRVLPKVSRIVAVSEPLADGAHALGVPRDRIDVVPNGVDHELFKLRDRASCRAGLGLDPNRRLVVYVGRLERRKGVLELLSAFDELERDQPLVDVVLIGDGEDGDACRARAERSKGRLRCVGNQPLSAVAEWIGACDLLTLPSHAEGTPNVVIEALTSGRRVVATDVGGIPAVVNDERLGVLVPPMDPARLAAAIAQQAFISYDPREVAELGGRGDWTESAERLYASLVRARETVT